MRTVEPTKDRSPIEKERDVPPDMAWNNTSNEHLTRTADPPTNHKNGTSSLDKRDVHEFTREDPNKDDMLGFTGRSSPFVGLPPPKKKHKHDVETENKIPVTTHLDGKIAAFKVISFEHPGKTIPRPSK